MKNKKNKKYIFSILFILFPAICFSETILKIGQIGDIKSLEPYRNAAPNYLMIENLHDQLLFNDRNRGFESELATSWKISSDYKSVIIKLRPGMFTHDGTPVDSKLLKWVLEERGKQSWPNITRTVVFGKVSATVDIIDDRTAKINFSEAFANMESKLSLLMLADPDMFDKKDGSKARFNEEESVIGTGPFKMVEYVPGSHMKWERFENYWQNNVPKFDRVHITYYGDGASMMAALETGEVDLVFRPPYEEMARFKNKSGFKLWVPETLGLSSILMVNPNAPGLEDSRVRQAIRLAIDRQAISNAVFEGFGLPTASPAVKSSFAYSPNLEVPPRGDITKAKNLMKQAGNPKVSVKLTYGSNDSAYRMIGEILQANLKKIGIDLVLDPQERNNYINMRTSQTFQMMPSVMAGANGHPADLTDSFVFRPKDNGFFNDPNEVVIKEFKDYQKWFDLGMKAKNDSDKKEAWSNVLQAVKDGSWVIHLSGQPFAMVSSSRVKGITWTQHDKPVLKYAYID